MNYHKEHISFVINNITYCWCQNYYNINKMPKDKLFLIIRPSKRIILSNTSYHSETCEPWCHQRIPPYVKNKLSYQEQLNKHKNINEKIFFEMQNYSKKQLTRMYDDIQTNTKDNLNINNNLMILNVSDLEKNMSMVCDFINFDKDTFANVCLSTSELNKSKKINNYNEQLFNNRFNKLFPNDIEKVIHPTVNI
jgi:hypothetical protein